MRLVIPKHIGKGTNSYRQCNVKKLIFSELIRLILV
jgi:hypothetical protein